MTRSWFRTRTIPTHLHIPVGFSLFGLACLLLAGIVGCDEGPTGGGKTGTDEPPLLTTMPDGQTDVSLYPTLEWYFDIPDGAVFVIQPVFEVYFGRGSNPPRIAQGLTDMQFQVGPLEYGEQYHWRVVAQFEGMGESSSPTRSFRTVEEYRYPLAHGNSWTYNVTTTFGSEPEVMTYSVFARNTVDCPEPCNLVSLILAQGGPLPEPPYSTYLQADSGLFVVHAKVGGSAILPKQAAPDGAIRWRGREFASMGELAALFAEMPPRSANFTGAGDVNAMAVLRYPLEEGNSWVFNSLEQGGAFRIVKEVTALDVSITSTAGTFPCYEITWQYDIDNDGTIEPDIHVADYVGPVGLVRREIRIEGMYRYDYEGNIICRCTYETLQQLTEFVLH